MILHFSLDFSQRLSIICKSLKRQKRKVAWLEFLFTSINSRLGASEACNSETSIGVNKKTSPRKACSPSQSNRKGAAGTDSREAPKACTWVSMGTPNRKTQKKTELVKLTQMDSDKK